MADEAEAWYDVDVLAERGRVRSGRKARPSHVVAVRVTDHDLAVVDARATLEGTS